MTMRLGPVNVDYHA